MGRFNYKKLLTRCCSALRKKPKQVEFAGYPNCTFHRTSAVVSYTANTPVPWADVYDQFLLPPDAQAVMVTVALSSGPSNTVFTEHYFGEFTTLSTTPKVLIVPSYTGVFPYSVFGLGGFPSDTTEIREGDEPHDQFGVFSGTFRDYALDTHTDADAQVQFEVVWVNAGCCLAHWET